MKRNIKRAGVLFAAVTILWMTVFSTLGAPAESLSDLPVYGQIWFEATAPDADGFFDVTVSAENVEFLVSELAFRYDRAVVCPVVIDTGEPTADFAAFSEAVRYDGLNRIGEKLDAEQGYFLFTLFVSPGAESNFIRNNRLHFAEKTQLYRFRFRKIGQGSCGFEIADAYGEGAYDAFFPDGAVITTGGGERPICEIRILCDGEENVADSVYYYHSELFPREFTKEARLAGTVYLIEDDYAAAVDGALTVIEPKNRVLTPYRKDGAMYFPLRFVCEKLGAQVAWDEETQIVTVTDKDGFVSTVNLAEITAHTVGREIVRGGNTAIVERDFTGGVALRGQRTFVTGEILTALCGARIYENGNEFVFYTGLPAWDPERDAEKQAMDAMRYVTSPFLRMFL